MLDNKYLYSKEFWAFNFATATVGFVLNIASMLQVCTLLGKHRILPLHALQKFSYPKTAISPEMVTTQDFRPLGSLSLILSNLPPLPQVRVTSPLTHMVVGAFKGAVTTCLGVVLYGNKMNITSTIGVAILISSSFAYSYFKYQHTQGEQKLRESSSDDESRKDK